MLSKFFQVFVQSQQAHCHPLNNWASLRGRVNSYIFFLSATQFKLPQFICDDCRLAKESLSPVRLPKSVQNGVCETNARAALPIDDNRRSANNMQMPLMCQSSECSCNMFEYKNLSAFSATASKSIESIDKVHLSRLRSAQTKQKVFISR